MLNAIYEAKEPSNVKNVKVVENIFVIKVCQICFFFILEACFEYPVIRECS